MVLAVKFFLFAAALVPIVISWATFFPFIFGKTVFFRSLVEIALILFLFHSVYSLWRGQTDFLKEGAEFLASLFKNPLFLFILAFFVFSALSAVFAENSYRAFWGDLERGEGLFGLLHYLIFLILALFVFEKKDWLIFFKVSLLVGFFLIFYAFLQYFGVRRFPLALAPKPRPDSWIGNPAFLATHMLFLAVFAWIVFSESRSPAAPRGCRFYLEKFWLYFSPALILLSLAAVFITRTRGAIAGLGAGLTILFLYFALNKKQPSALRKISAAALTLVLIFAGVFWLTRAYPVWQSVPGLDRLAKTAFLDINDSSTQFRLITWKLSWNAFKERPLLGWGPENYLVAYEKYYDPDYALYGETWLDRAHNKVIDVGVMGGTLGLAAYLGIFGAALYLLLKKHETFGRLTAPIILAGLAAYFVQNLFLFDQIVSYLAFFALLGFLLTGCRAAPAAAETGPFRAETFGKNKLAPVLFSLVPIALSGLLIYGLYAYNYVPYVQAKAFKESPGLGRSDLVVAKLKEAMYPYNFAQYNIRGNGVDVIYLDGYFYRPDYVGNRRFWGVGELLIKGMDEIAKREPYDVRILIREVEMLNGVTRVVDEETAAPLYKKAEELMREAVKRAPKRQEVYYHLSFNLAGQKRYDESIEAARYAVSLSPGVARAHFNLGLAYALVGRNDESLEELAAAERLNPSFNLLMSEDVDSLIAIYNSLRKYEKVAELVTKSATGRLPYSFKREYYEAALTHYAERKDAENFIVVAEYLSRFDDIREDMEVLIDLAAKDRWDIIHKL